MKLKLFIAMASALMLGACATTTVNFRSSPQKARVTVKPLGTGASKDLGETPLVISASEIDKEFKGSGPIQVEFVKEGYKPLKMLVTELSALDLTLDVELQPASGLEDPASMNAQIERLFEAQRLAKIQRFPEALKLLEDVKKTAPQLSASYEIEAGVYFLQNKKTEALDSYRAAAQLNPKSNEAIRMRDMIEAELMRSSGGRLPASTKAGAQ